MVCVGETPELAESVYYGILFTVFDKVLRVTLQALRRFPSNKEKAALVLLLLLSLVRSMCGPKGDGRFNTKCELDTRACHHFDL